MASNKEKETTSTITKKDINKMALRSIFMQTSMNYERMQSAGWLLAMLPVLKKIYKDDKGGLSSAMQDNLEFINTNNTVAPLLMGLLTSLEENHEKRSTIKGLRIALFGPLAGIGDAIFWFTVLPIVAGITASFAKQGSILGPLIFFLVYVGIFFSRIGFARLGYYTGSKAITKIRDNSSMISKAASILGVTVIGGLIATYVNINVLSKIKVAAGHTISIQTQFLDKIFPNILALGYTFLLYWLLKKKNVSPVVLILITFVLAIGLSWLGVL
ncbi:PTS galactosamine transporter subunit IID [Latilactobacillus sakei]|uniref:PTS galactosamine transporter subunit IID n=1 Tax=Latilactobacillus sakei TaxID=1599 RepID=UPI0038F796B4